MFYKRLGLALLIPSKRYVVFVTKSINCLVVIILNLVSAMLISASRSRFPRARPQPLSEAKTASYRVFRHVLFPQESTALQLQSTIAIVVSSFRKLFQRTISAEKKHGDSWSASYGHVLWPTPTLGRPVRRRRKDLVETTKVEQHKVDDKRHVLWRHRH